MAEPIATQCCIAGGGPAGLMLGLLLARAGVRVVVLEKHADFLRDFRGDTIHPSTMEVLYEIGLLDAFLRLPHAPVSHVTAQFGTQRLRLADFSALPVHAPFIAMIPQWDFLNFIAAECARFPNFTLRRSTAAAGLIEAAGRVVGVRCATPAGPLDIRADLVVGADGRHSTLRAAAGLKVHDLGAPMDVLWFRLPRRPDDTAETQGRFDAGGIFIMLNRGDYWQCAFVIAKGRDAQVRAAGLEAFRASVAPLLPFAPERAREIASLDDVKLLTVAVDRLETWWRPGLICIGDAAHAMSPVGGVGINLAVQDAVAAANVLAAPLREGRATDQHLAAIQARRTFPVRATQRLQILMQNTIIAPVLAAGRVTAAPLRAPLAVRLLAHTPFLNRLPARLIGMGFRPEHVAAELREVWRPQV